MQLKLVSDEISTEVKYEDVPSMLNDVFTTFVNATSKESFL